MLTTLALAVMVQLAPSQPGNVTFSNGRVTHGIFGALRTGDHSFLPGDGVYLAFDANNLKVNAAGKASCSLTLELLDPSGKVVFKQAPRPQQVSCSLGGNSAHIVASVQIPPEQAPGDYTLKLTFLDDGSGTSQTKEQKLKVLPAAFGLVQVSTAADPAGKIARAPFGTVGEPLYVNFSVVGFGRDATSKQPNVEVSLKVTDEAGKGATPLTGMVNGNIPPDLKLIPMQFGLTLNRPGRFTVELTATDKIGGKTSTVTFPLKVMAAE